MSLTSVRIRVGDKIRDKLFTNRGEIKALGNSLISYQALNRVQLHLVLGQSPINSVTVGSVKYIIVNSYKKMGKIYMFVWVRNELLKIVENC